MKAIGAIFHWSYLPLELLWLIKDRLGYVSNLCSREVCSHWRNASSTYPSNKPVLSINDGVPCIMKLKDGKIEFISVTCNKKYTIFDMPLLGGDDCQVIYSKQGWILLLMKEKLNRYSNYGYPNLYYLVNPLTRATVEIPRLFHNFHKVDNVDGFPDEVAFSTDIDAHPRCLVGLIDSRNSGEITLGISYVDDDRKGWSSACYYTYAQRFMGRKRLLISGQLAYCFVDFVMGSRGSMVIFNLTTKQWENKVSWSIHTKDLYSVWYVAEWEGGLVRINDKDSSILRYNYKDNVWEKMRLKVEAKHTHWFFDQVYDHHQRLRICCAARIKGNSKAYTLVDDDVGHEHGVVSDFVSKKRFHCLDALGKTHGWVKV